ncbi:MAG: sigma 54-interacting transcriptional regulator [Nitrospinota bacterium]|nr:sigma 54-interacting transcriptional regulator [Nitrospinota bacterium]MDH5678761.1 sigma 54-interacting transcriptional regulator [Nitrospinota bacterium]MDH5757163.1 sigma 54-interacting transcriptional regulator [Nitrospinota bacterium]
MNQEKISVLIVDDEVGPLKLLTVAAGSAGLEPTPVQDATLALEAFSAKHFPVIFMDWMMPGMSGLELCSKIRAMEGGKWPVIVIFTAREDPQDLIMALNSGADDYIPKSSISVDMLRIRFTIARNKAAERAERHKMEEALAVAHNALERRYDDLCSALNNLRLGALLLDGDGKVRFISKRAEMFLETSSQRAIGAPWQSLLHTGEREKKELAVMMAGAHGGGKLELGLETEGGERRWLEAEVKEDPRGEGKKMLLLYDVSDVQNLRRQLEGEAKFFGMLGKSPPMMELRNQIRQFAGIDWTTLIEGETGAGKELIARAIHFMSPRKDKPFVAVNTASLSDSLLTSQLFGHKRGSFTGANQDHVGLFESAEGGTLFLDEIGDISPGMQVSLLRALEQGAIIRLGETRERKINVRFLAATHKDLGVEAKEGRFRQDLLFRIRGARITAPPLRERREDIELLARHFLLLARVATGKPVEGFGDEAMGAMMEYPWPGNVRELKSAVEYALINCGGAMIEKRNLPPEITGNHPYSALRNPANVEPDEMSVEEAMLKSRGNRSKAAKLLGISRSTLYRRLPEEPGEE